MSMQAWSAAESAAETVGLLLCNVADGTVTMATLAMVAFLRHPVGTVTLVAAVTTVSTLAPCYTKPLQTGAGLVVLGAVLARTVLKKRVNNVAARPLTATTPEPPAAPSTD